MISTLHESKYVKDDTTSATEGSISHAEEDININAIDINICKTQSSTSIPTDIMILEYIDESKQTTLNEEINTIKNTPNTEFDPDNIRGQIDTGTKASCTNMLFLLHDYRAYTSRQPSRIRLTAAIDNGNDSAIIPEGEGYLFVPANNKQGHIRVKTYYSPSLTSTLISENSIM